MSTETARPTVLIVDDEAGIRDSLAQLLHPHFNVLVAADGAEALHMTVSCPPDVMILDVSMPEIDGFSVLHSLRSSRLKIPVIMVSAAASVRQAVSALKSGASDFLAKPFEPVELTTLIEEVLHRTPEITVEVPGMAVGACKSINEAEQQRGNVGDFGALVGRSPTMERLYSRIQRVAFVDTTVLITGESGTGKELVARQIHSLSARRGGPFVSVNCAAIPDSLIESELFGHEKGAFTNAMDRRIGLCEMADGGTLFLDEIGDVSPSVQVKLLRFIQEQEFFRLGRSVPTKVNVRILSATNRNLEELVRQRHFREDLWYRVNVLGVAVPALREREGDIPYLFDILMQRLQASYGGRQLKLTAEAREHLVNYSWPGNVRELQNVVESLMALATADTITSDDLPLKIRMLSGLACQAQLGEDLAGRNGGGLPFQDAERLFESEILLNALRKTNFVQSRAAALLGISRRMLKYKMDKLGIEASRKGGRTPKKAKRAS